MDRLDAFEKELAALINKHSLEEEAGNTPDYVIAAYLVDCLESMGNAVALRDKVRHVPAAMADGSIYRITSGASERFIRALPGDNIKAAGKV